eukprot:UN26063
MSGRNFAKTLSFTSSLSSLFIHGRENSKNFANTASFSLWPIICCLFFLRICYYTLLLFFVELYNKENSLTILSTESE